MTLRLCVILLALSALGATLSGCETTPLNPRPDFPDNPGVATEIGKPLASVNLVVPDALESCGFFIDKRQFVDGVVNLQAKSTSGMRVHIRLSSIKAERTFVEIRPEDDEPEGIMIQMVGAIRDLVWK